MTDTNTIATFRNRQGLEISTGDPATAQKYRERPEDFEEIETKVVPYTQRSKADLQAEIDLRNSGRADVDVIAVAPKATKTDLVDAIEADDKAQADRDEQSADATDDAGTADGVDG